MKKPPRPQGTPQTMIFECSACGTTHHSGAGLPDGWSIQPSHGLSWCPDCTTSETINRTMKSGRKAA